MAIEKVCRQSCNANFMNMSFSLSAWNSTTSQHLNYLLRLGSSSKDLKGKIDSTRLTLEHPRLSKSFTSHKPNELRLRHRSNIFWHKVALVHLGPGCSLSTCHVANEVGRDVPLPQVAPLKGSHPRWRSHCTSCRPSALGSTVQSNCRGCFLNHVSKLMYVNDVLHDSVVMALWQCCDDVVIIFWWSDHHQVVKRNLQKTSLSVSSFPSQDPKKNLIDSYCLTNSKLKVHELRTLLPSGIATKKIGELVMLLWANGR